jgi:hypothetical protein
MKPSFFMPSTWAAIFGDPGAVNAADEAGAKVASCCAPHPPIVKTVNSPSPHLNTFIEAPVWM